MPKYYIATMAALFAAFACFGQEKVIESSSRKSPEWVNGMTENYIITYAYGKDIDEAKTRLQVKIREEIVNAVATYVRSSTSYEVENTQRGQVINTVEQFKKKSTIQTGDVPFLKGISLSKADEYYWAKTKNKETGTTSVTYHVKYPFSSGDLHRLIKEFEAQDKAMTEKMEKTIGLSKRPKSIEDINQYIRQLEQFRDYFIDARKETAQLEITRLKEQLNAVSIEVVSNEPGKLVYQLMLGETPISTAQKGRAKGSLCVQNITSQQQGAQQIVEYDFENCFEDEINNLTVELKVGNKNIKQTVPIRIKEVKVEIFVKDPIRLMDKTIEGDQVTTFKLKVPIVAKYEGTFAVNKVSLDLTDNISLEVADIFEEFSNKGVHEFYVTVHRNISLEDYKNLNGAEIAGTIYYTALETGETLRYKMFNQEIRTE